MRASLVSLFTCLAALFLPGFGATMKKTGLEIKTSFVSIRNSVLLGAVALLIPSMAQAHLGLGPANGFNHGFEHPLSGWDHICAMVAVGLWAAQMGGRSLWAVPLTFVSMMAVGGFLGMTHVHIPFVEANIAFSVLMLGVLITAAIRLPSFASIPTVGLFAICHGHAHGEEMPATASGLDYALGFVLATVLLHAVGIGLGVGFQKISQPTTFRLTGIALFLCGVYLLSQLPVL